MIKITDLVKSFNGKRVLDNLNCNIKTGSVYGLVGANGAGKSTLLRIILGIYQKDSGSVEIDGTETYSNEELKQKMAFVPDDLYFLPHYTLKGMANFYQNLYKNFDMNMAMEMAKTLNLKTDEKIQNFSKGMKRQCSLICAFSTNAEYIFFDETFDGIDPIVRNYFKKVIKSQMEKKETTIIMTSHNLRELEDICDNLGLLYKGGILFESDINSIKTNMFKIQISFKEEFDKEKLKGLEILNFKKVGSVATVIIKGDRNVTETYLKSLKPVLLDFLPLTLEEVFIYEMEVLGYEFNQVI